MSTFLKVLCKAQVSKQAVDPSIFLEALQNSYRKVQPTFRWNKQQDVSDVFQHLLGEVQSVCFAAYQRLSVTIASTITCNVCYESSVNEQSESILSVPLGLNITECIRKYMEPSSLTAENQWKCLSCNAIRDATRYHHFADASNVLVIQLKRFAVAHDSSVYKIASSVNIQQPLQLHISERNVNSEIMIARNYVLRAFISHTGNLNSGHYTANVKVRNIWYKCNDSAVTKVRYFHNVSKEAYLLFYVAA